MSTPLVELVVSVAVALVLSGFIFAIWKRIAFKNNITNNRNSNIMKVKAKEEEEEEKGEGGDIDLASPLVQKQIREKAKLRERFEKRKEKAKQNEKKEKEEKEEEKEEKEEEKALPPGQYPAKKFIVLDLGIRPSLETYNPWEDPQNWTVSFKGDSISSEFSMTLSELASLGLRSYRMDWHCVTGWSYSGVGFIGVPLSKILSYAKVKPNWVAIFQVRNGNITLLPLPLPLLLLLFHFLLFPLSSFSFSISFSSAFPPFSPSLSPPPSIISFPSLHRADLVSSFRFQQMDIPHPSRGSI